MSRRSASDDPTRLFARFRAIIACAFLGLVIVAGVMITLSVGVEERRDRQILTELLRGHAYLLDSQAVAFRRVAEAAAERLRSRLEPLASAPQTRAELSCAGREAASIGRLNARFAETERERDRRVSGGVGSAGDVSWAAAVAAVDFVAIEMEVAAPNIARLMFIAPDGRAASWLGAPPRGDEARAIIAPASCGDNPTGAAIWVVEPVNADAGGDDAEECDASAADGAIRLIRPIDIGLQRAGYVALELDACAIRRMNADLAIDDGYAFLVAGGDALVGAPNFSAPVLRLLDAEGLHPSTQRAAGDPFAQPSGDLFESGERLIFVQTLSAAPWTMIATIDATSLRIRTAGETAGRLLLLLALIAGTLAMTVALTRREFIDPARALVADIVARGSGEAPPHYAPPPGWIPYFRRIRTVFQENTEAAALRSELSIAARMQASILPTNFPAPDAPLAIWGAATPAQEVGGDFFDFFDLPDGRVAAVIADVSGKGVPAALFMVLTRTLIRATATDGGGPAAAVTKVNRLLAAENPETMFVTLFYGVIDPLTGRMTYANAGHNAPYLVSPRGVVTALPSTDGAALGVFEDVEYGEAEAEIGPDVSLILFTDGVTEAMDPANGEYGEARLETRLGEIGDVDPRRVIEHIEADVAAFADGAPQADDLTMMTMKRRAGAPLKASFGDDLQAIPVFAARLEAWGAAVGASDPTVHAVSLSLDELMTNAIQHGSAGAPRTGFRMDVVITLADDRLTVVLTDNGGAFDPFSAAPPDLESTPEDRPIGGLGVHFAKTLTDTHAYERRDDRNVVTLTKSLTGDIAL
ncbi:MAG: SpoIIE family protein phosphatase [Pseudomonadota bacterium]